MHFRSIFAIIFFSGCLCFFYSSCISYKEVPLFQDLPQQGETAENITNFSPLIIQENDVLSIAVTSLNPEASAIFNPPVDLYSGIVNQANQTALINQANQIDQATRGFRVDQNGEIRLPYIGALKVVGLTTPEINDLIAQKLEKYLKEPVVNVRILNYRVFVFGGVGSPGIYSVTNERMTIVEALILAGEMDLTALRNNVLLIREIKGERKFVRFDFRSRSAFTSPYFYLKTNDVIYVEPGTSRERRDALVGNFSLLTSVISFILILSRL